MGNRQQAPFLIVLLTILGMSAIPLGLFSPHTGRKGEATAAPTQPTTQPSEPSPPPSEFDAELTSKDRLAVLAPLQDFWAGSPLRLPELSSVQGDRDEQRVVGLLQKSSPNLDALIATVPDPRNTIVSYQFDIVLEAIERAMERQGYVAVRYCFPWLTGTRSSGKENDSSSSSSQGSPVYAQFSLQGIQLNMAGVAPTGSTSSRHQPGTVLFRRVDDRDPGRFSLLLLLLVPESPIWGIDKMALGASFDFAVDAVLAKNVKIVGLASFDFVVDAVLAKTVKIVGLPPLAPFLIPPLAPFLIPPLAPFLIHSSQAWGIDRTTPTGVLTLGNILRCLLGPRAIRIVGPNFSGSQTSMIQATRDWLERNPEMKGRKNLFRWYNGSATEIKQDAFQGVARGLNPGLTLQSTLYPNSVLREQLLDFLARYHLNPLLSRADSKNYIDIALLVESNTGYGGSYPYLAGEEKCQKKEEILEDHARWGKLKFRYHYYSYPINVSQVRIAYQQSGVSSVAAPVQLATSVRLPIADDTSSLPYRDLIRPAAPPVTAVHDELTLTRLLDELSHHDYEYVGVISTNVFDQLFLFQKIRTACPNTQLIVNTPELLFSHHEAIPYLRGMLVVSSYPLYPDNQAWSFPHRGDLFQIGFGSSTSPSIFNAAAAHLAEMSNGCVPEQLIEYGLPFEDLFAPPATYKSPAVWISVVGQRSPYPVSVDKPSCTDKIGIYTAHTNGKKEPDGNINYHLPVPTGSWLVLFILFSLGLLYYSMVICFGHQGNRWWVLFDIFLCVFILTLGYGLDDQFDSSGTAVFFLLVAALLLIAHRCWSSAKLERSLRSEFEKFRVVVEDAKSLLKQQKAMREETAETATKKNELGNLSARQSGLAKELQNLQQRTDELSRRLYESDCLAASAMCEAAKKSREQRTVDKMGKTAGQLEKNQMDQARDGQKAAGQELRDLVDSLDSVDVVLNRRKRERQNGELERDVRAMIMAMSFGFYLVFGTPLWILVWVLCKYPTSWNHWDPPLGFLILALLTLLTFFAASVAFVHDLRTSKTTVWNATFRIGYVLAPLLMIRVLLLRQEPRDLLMYCERAMVLTNGVTPLMPVLFLALLGAAWQGCELRRVRTLKRLNDTNPREEQPSGESQATQTNFNQDQHTGESQAAQALTSIKKTYEDFRSFLGTQPRIRSYFLKKDTRVYTLILLTFTLTILVLAGLRATPTVEFEWFQVGYRAVFSMACLVLLFKLIQLITLWRIARDLLEAITSLPIIKAFDRLPLRAGVFGQVTDRTLKQSEREHLITWQARLLARDFSRIKDQLFSISMLPSNEEKSGQLKIIQKDLEETLCLLKDGGGEFEPSHWRILSRNLVYVVEPFWLHRPIAVAFADVPLPGIKSESLEPPQEWAFEKLANWGVSDKSVSRLRNWLFAAEDYMALISVSYLNLIFAYLWSLIEFLVIGGLALLLSITSYPFEPQGILLTTMGLTIAVLMFVIASIVIQMNRNELVSRIQKTPPHKISLDRPFLGAVFTYILPLLFALAALSLSLSDLFRSWFEPIFR